VASGQAPIPSIGIVRAVFRKRRAEIIKEKLCDQWFNDGINASDNPALRARNYGAVYAVGRSSKRERARRRAEISFKELEEWNNRDLVWEFARGAEIGLTKAIEALKPLGYTVKDFDKWGWLPDDPEQRPARLAELGL